MDKIFALQNEIQALSKTETNPFFESKYFDINGLLKQLKPLLEKHNLTVIQPLAYLEGADKVYPALMTIVSEGAKELVKSCIPLPDIQDPQKMGSAITYYRRYALQSLFLLQAEDDDANSASGKGAKKEFKTFRNKEERDDYNKKAKEDYQNNKDPLDD